MSGRKWRTIGWAMYLGGATPLAMLTPWWASGFIAACGIGGLCIARSIFEDGNQ